MADKNIRAQVIEDLKQYPSLKKKIILLRYEQSHPARVTDGEVIDSMALSRPVSDRADGEKSCPPNHSHHPVVHSSRHARRREPD